METYRPIGELIGRVRARWQALRLLQAATRAAVGVSLVLLAWLIVAPWAARSALALGAMGILSLLLAAAAVLWGVAPLRGRPSDAQLARFIEEHAPSLDDRLVTAVDLVAGAAKAGHHPKASALAGPMLADAAARAGGVDVDAVVPGTLLRRSALRTAAAAAILVFVAFLASGPARQAVDAASLVLFPSRVVFDVRPGDARIRTGMPLSIEARLVGNRSPINAQVQIRPRPIEGGLEMDEWRTVDMTRDSAGRFRLVLGSVTAPFTYRVVAENLTSPTYAVTVARAPRVMRIDVNYVYPPALGLKPRSERDGGDIYAPSGTDVRVRVHTDLPVSSGRMTLGDGKASPFTTEAATQLSTTFKVVEDNSYRVSVVDREGLSSGGETEYFIRVLDDRPPEVHITKPAGDRAVTRLEEVDIEAQADDDYGIDRFEVVYAVRGGAEQVVALDVPRRATSASARHTLYLEDLDVQPGDFVSYYVRARDLTRGKRSNETRSDIFFLDVRPYEQEFSLAQSQSMAGSGYAGAIDELVTAQRQVVVATWKLDRRSRSQGVRSERDIRSVARAQADIKSRVEQTASSFRESTMRDPRRRMPGGGDGPAGQQRVEAAAMDAAALAMDQAVTSLDALQTAAALPPEMEALNHLLKAQADIKHRQVAMDQSAAGAAGNSNRNFDISTLFDRELRRQQQTSYETLKIPEKRQQSDSAALDRIKDLARRQDELLRRQQELARVQLSDEELTRRLEQLTREQVELRQAAEEMSRQASDRPGPRSRSGGDGEVGKQMRDVSEAMRRAAGDLQRGAPRPAGSNARRALERLRDLERRLQASQPADRPRAPGDESRRLSAALSRAQELREKLDQIGRALEAAGRQDRPSAGARGTQQVPGERGRTGEGQQSTNGVDLARLNEESSRQMREAKDLIERLRREDPGSRNGAGFTLEGQGMISSAPGTEGFKQDFARWETLKRQVALALEQAEGALSRKLQATESRNRLAAGVEGHAPPAYQTQVDSYFRALATKGQNKNP